MERLSHLRESSREADTQRYKEASKRRLLKILTRKGTTCFIGALDKIEKYIGVELWGHGKLESDCTPEQLFWRDVWEPCRTEILNNGNNQIRAMESELSQYTVNWDRHQYNLPAGGPQGV